MCVCVRAGGCAGGWVRGCVFTETFPNKSSVMFLVSPIRISYLLYHTLTIHCTNPKALSFNKIAVQRINYVGKCLVQVTSTRTTAYSSIHHRVVLTADKNITWFLKQRVNSCSGRSWLRRPTSSRLLNTVVNEI